MCDLKNPTAGPEVRAALQFLLFLDPLGSFQRLPGLAVFSPCSRPDFAIPSQPLPIHHVFQSFGHKSFKKSCRCLFLKILVVAAGCSVFWGVLLSIGSPFVKHRIFPLIPVVCTIVFFRRRVYAYIFCPLPSWHLILYGLPERI